MGVSFTSPWWWLILLPALIVTGYLRLPWLKIARRVGGPLWSKELKNLLIRLVILSLIVAGLAGTHKVSVIQQQAVIFALDVSASVRTVKSQGEEWVRAALQKKPPSELAGVISFGQKPLVEEFPSSDPNFLKTATAPGDEASRLGEAFNLAQAVLPLEVRKRVILLSDGRDTGGKAVAAAQRLREHGVRIDVVPLGEKTGPDIRLENLKLSPRANENEKIILEATAEADSECKATFFLERDGVLLSATPVNLQAGENRLSFPLTAGNTGLHVYRAYLVAEDAQKDFFAVNNEAGAAQEVTGPPQVLVIAPQAREAASLVRALKATGRINIKVITPDLAPQGLTSWARYQAVFLVNVPASELGEKTMAEIETYVRDGGGGLVMIGGPNSFGPGGYAGTPVEKALPVKMNISGRGEIPSLGLVLVVDKSGSMAGIAGGADKISLAKEAAARSVSLLTPRDQAGVIAFDAYCTWAVPLGPVKDKDLIRKEIGQIYADGGTEIFPPLLGAYQALKDVPAQVKHIILLTDGISASGGPYQKLLENMRQDGITLTCVAVGQGADSGMLKALSELGRGRFYATSEADSIPSIFTKETIMATRSFAVNEKFFPQVASAGVLLQGINQVPPLEGYVTASTKERAEMALVSHRGDPVLTAWQYGLGRAVAWTPDIAGRMCASWLTDQVFPKLWGNVLSWILPAVNTSSVQIYSNIEETGEVQVTVDDPAHWQEVRNYILKITAPDGQTQNAALTPAGPGRYTTRLGALKTGAYLACVVLPAGEAKTPLAQGSLVVPYPAEYKKTGVDLACLKEIARAGGGKILSAPEEAFAPNLKPVRTSKDLTSLFLILAGLLWFFDVTGRRLSFGSEERLALKKAWSVVKRKLFFRSRRRFVEPSLPWAEQALHRVARYRFSKKETKKPPAPVSFAGIKEKTLSQPQPDEKGEKDVTARLLAAKRRRKK